MPENPKNHPPPPVYWGPNGPPGGKPSAQPKSVAPAGHAPPPVYWGPKGPPGGASSVQAKNAAPAGHAPPPVYWGPKGPPGGAPSVQAKNAAPLGHAPSRVYRNDKRDENKSHALPAPYQSLTRSVTNIQRAEAPRRPQRQRARKKVPLSVLQAYYGAFGAEERSVGDGKQTTSVTLDLGRRVKYEGKTGQGHGHAEIDALYQALIRNERDVDFLNGSVLTCEAKSVCVHCATILGLLRIRPSVRTFKTSKTMGSTQWSLPPDLRDKIAAWYAEKNNGDDLTDALQTLGQ